MRRRIVEMEIPDRRKRRRKRSYECGETRHAGGVCVTKKGAED